MAWGFLSLLVASFFSHFVGSLSSEALSSSSLIPSGAKATALVLPPPPAEIRLSSGEEIDGSDHKLPPAVAGRPGQLVGLLAQGGLVLRVDDGVDVGLDGGGTQGGRDEDPIPCAGDSADCSRRRRRRRTSTWGQAYRTPSR